MTLPFCCTGTFIIVGAHTRTHTHAHSILLVLSASWEPRIIAANGGAAHSWVWALSFVPLDIFRCSQDWPNRMKIHSESQTTALSKLWCYIKRKGSTTDFTKATSSPSSKWGTSQPKEMRIWFGAISSFWCAVVSSIISHLVLHRKLIKEVWKSFGSTALPQNM